MNSIDLIELAKGYETIANFIGKDGWRKIEPFLIRSMKKRNCISFGYYKNDGSFFQMSIENSFRIHRPPFSSIQI